MARADAESARIVEQRERRRSTAFQFMSGSPIPMNTMFVTSIGSSSRRISRTWPAISNGVEVAREAHRAGRAEGARSAHPACDEMQSVMRFAVGDRDRLDRLAVGEPEEKLPRAVGGLLPRGELEPRQRRIARRASARSARGSSVIVVEARGRAGPEPAQHLADAIARLAELGHRGGEADARRRRG